ncbi:hypothetical protein AK88_05178 [Plasmodium fragile]|uniref:Uncharacterized protein n=1 Tax=Plasmodium fragile TaxID=5857 RepID=A0A0D9QDZ3_PLAFR|nr:uncharacterized protein AK88_05178 [Plasmodium fragile]KJP85184.1 hypothetical protein AK88_05178 [Plasmodium fragile]
MAHYLDILWKEYIGKGESGVRKDDKDFQKTFWEHVNTVWQTFTQHMEDANDDTMIDLLCQMDQAPAGNAQAQGETFSEKDKAVCWLALKALGFKHGIKFDVTPMGPADLDNTAAADGVMPYMKCILVNIFMKRIIGEKCLRTDGARNAFKAAQHLVRDGEQKEPNMECEKEDRKDGTRQRSQNTQYWNLAEIMHRWLDRNKGYLTDGQVGVLGPDCTVQRDKSAQDIQAEANKKIEEVGQEIENTVKDILQEIDKSPEGTSMETIIKTVKQGKDSASKTPQEHGQSPGETQTTTSSTPGRSENDHAGHGGGAVANHAHGDKPAPAKPVKPAPVAATPAGTVTPGSGTTTTSGSGMTTTSSGGGGGRRGGGAGGEKGKKAATDDNCPWQSILEGKSRHVHVLQHYDSAELKALKAVLQAFIDYMQQNTDQMDAYGANCANTGWDDFGDTHQYKGQTVADVVRCRLMSTALFFANKQGKHGNSEKAQKTDDDKLYEKFRCEVAHVFGYMLKHQYCKTQGWKRGVEYAWKTMKKMHKDKHGNILFSGPVMDGTCKQCGYEGSHTQLGIINGHIAEWFVTEGIMGEIAHIEQQLPCEKDWKKYKQSQGVTDTDPDITNTLPEVKQTEEKVRTQTKTAFAEVTKIVNQKIKDLAGGKKPEAPPATVPAVTKEVIPEKQGPTKGTGEEGVARSDESAPAPGASGQGPGQGPGPGQQPPPPTPPTGNTCTESSTSTITHGSSVSVSLGCTPDSELGVPPSTPLPPSDPAPGEDNVINSGNGIKGTEKNEAEEDQEKVQQEATEQAARERAKQAEEEERRKAEVEQEEQYEAKERASAKGVLNKVSGDIKIDVGPGSRINNVPGGYVPPEGKPTNPGSMDKDNIRPRNPSLSGPDGPDLTADVLTATTPVLFFLSVVTVALLGYSLWKASTIGTSSTNGASHIDTIDGTTVGTPTVSLRDATDVWTRGTRNCYDGRATGSPVKNTVFDDMRRKFKPKVHVKNPVPVKKKPQGATAQNKLKECCQKLKRFKMGRTAWSILIVLSTLLYSFFMSIIHSSMLSSLSSLTDLLLSLTAFSGIPILCIIMYLCVLLCFCRSKTGKCLLDKIWKNKKKEKKEAPTETEKKGEVNKKQEALKEPGTFQKQGGPTKKEAPGTAGESEKLEAHKKPEVPKTPDAPKEAEAPKKTEVPEKQDAPKNGETPKKPETPDKQDAPKKPGESEKPEVPKKSEASAKKETPEKP